MNGIQAALGYKVLPRKPGLQCSECHWITGWSTVTSFNLPAIRGFGQLRYSQPAFQNCWATPAPSPFFPGQTLGHCSQVFKNSKDTVQGSNYTFLSILNHALKVFWALCEGNWCLQNPLASSNGEPGRRVKHSLFSCLSLASGRRAFSCKVVLIDI